MKPEAQFEKDLSFVAPLLGCIYIKIPDTKMINKFNRHNNREEKRPFDAVLVTPNCNYCIECKINYNTLETHQSYNQTNINLINQTFFVFRKRINKKVKYQIEHNSQMLFDTDKIEELIKFMVFL